MLDLWKSPFYVSAVDLAKANSGHKPASLLIQAYVSVRTIVICEHCYWNK